jgi:hypothetical protein
MLIQLGISLIDNKQQCNINETLWLSYNHFWCILFVCNLIVHDFDYDSRMNLLHLNVAHNAHKCQSTSNQ